MNLNKWVNLTEETYGTYNNKYSELKEKILDKKDKLNKEKHDKEQKLSKLKTDSVPALKKTIANLEIEIERAECVLDEIERYSDDTQQQIEKVSSLREAADDLCFYVNAEDNNQKIDDKLKDQRNNYNFYIKKKKELRGDLSKIKSSLIKNKEEYNNKVGEIKKLENDLKRIDKDLRICDKDIEKIFISKKFLDDSYKADDDNPKAVKLTYLNPNLKSIAKDKNKTKKKIKKNFLGDFGVIKKNQKGKK